MTLWSLEKKSLEKDFSDPSNEKFTKALAVAPDAKWCATGDDKGNLNVWALPDCTLKVSKSTSKSAVVHLTISPDSQEIATAAFDGEVTIWKADSLEVKSKFKAADEALQLLRYIAPSRLAVASRDTSIWNTESGKQENKLSEGPYNATFSVSHDGSQLLYGSGADAVLWSIKDSKPIKTIPNSISNNDLVAFSPDGKWVATSSKLMISIWEVESGQLVQVIDAWGWATTGMQWLPKSKLLMIASVNGRVRFWGSEAVAKELNMTPVHPTSELVSDPKQPATPAKLLQVIDVRTLPVLPGATIGIRNEFLSNYTVAVTAEEAKRFYHYVLGERGWKLSPIDKNSPDLLNFTKDGFGLSVYLSAMGPSQVNVNLSLQGDVDLTQVPKATVAKPEGVFESRDTVIYRVKTDLVQLETDLLQKLTAAGWTAYSRLNTSQNDGGKTRNLTFLRNAVTLNVFIQPAVDDPNSFNVSYSKMLTTRSLPIPADAHFVEFDGSTQPMLVASTAMNLSQTRDYYEREMTQQGWLRRDSRKQFDEKSGWMEFVRGQCDVPVLLVAAENGRTWVRVGEDVEKASWQLAKKAEVESAVTENGIEAADLPIGKGWSVSKYDQTGQQVEVTAEAATTLAVLEFYTEALGKLGWSTDGRGVKSDDYLLADFKKGKAEVTLRVRRTGDAATFSISGDGLLWNKSAGAKEAVSYEAWLRANNHPATMDLLEQYKTEMQALATK